MSEPTLYVPSLIEQLQACAADRRNLEEARAVMQAAIAELLDHNTATKTQRWFPVTMPMTSNQAAKSGPSPARIPWSVAEKAYSIYVGRYGRGQSLTRIAERGGFYAEELDDLFPGWRDEASEITALRAELETTRQARDALLRDAGRGEGWDSMELAPKSGEFVVWVKRAGCMGALVVHYCDHVEDHPPIEPALYFWTGYQFAPLTEKPTHWRPLPAPPVADPPRPEETS